MEMIGDQVPAGLCFLVAPEQQLQRYLAVVVFQKRKGSSPVVDGWTVSSCVSRARCHYVNRFDEPQLLQRSWATEKVEFCVEFCPGLT